MIRLACATLSAEGFGETDFSKTFDLLPRIGFRFVEFNLWHPSSLAPSVLRGLAQRCYAAGLIPVAIHLGGGMGGDLARDFCHKVYAMQAARALGAGLIVTSGGHRVESIVLAGAETEDHRLVLDLARNLVAAGGHARMKFDHVWIPSCCHHPCSTTTPIGVMPEVAAPCHPMICSTTPGSAAKSRGTCSSYTATAAASAAARGSRDAASP